MSKENESDKWQKLYAAVNGRVNFLQRELASDSSFAKKELAALRRASSQLVGLNPDAWGSTIGIIPEELQGKGDNPNSIEKAVHLAITTFAGHQQSQNAPMHVHGMSFGESLGLLSIHESRSESAVWRRFSALATAKDISEIQNHLRSLSGLLRSAKIPTDYAQLCVDLIALQSTKRAPGVRLKWGRDYHRARRRPSES